MIGRLVIVGERTVHLIPALEWDDFFHGQRGGDEDIVQGLDERRVVPYLSIVGEVWFRSSEGRIGTLHSVLELWFPRFLRLQRFWIVRVVLVERPGRDELVGALPWLEVEVPR